MCLFVYFIPSSKRIRIENLFVKGTNDCTSWETLFGCTAQATNIIPSSWEWCLSLESFLPFTITTNIARGKKNVFHYVEIISLPFYIVLPPMFTSVNNTFFFFKKSISGSIHFSLYIFHFTQHYFWSEAIFIVWIKQNM